MCILSYLPSNIPATDELLQDLRNGGLNNPDGHGWAIASPEYDHILMGHSLDLTEALEEFYEFRNVYTEGPALFHSRWATHGSVSTANCHPFFVDNDKRTVLAHNGVLPTDAHPSKGDDRSDTRILADELLPGRYAKLDRRSTRRSLATWAGKGNKLLILTTNPEYNRNVYLVNASAGEWDRNTGVWHSNSGYMYSPTWYSKSWKSALKESSKSSEADAYSITYDAEGREICCLCGEGTLSEWTRYCNNFRCNSCGDCFEWIEDCQCHSDYLKSRQIMGGGALDPDHQAVNQALALGWSHE